jgi:flagellin-like protein
MKGVSSVIAIILILMIVIALAALAYTWFSGIFASLTSTAGTAVTTTTGAMATQFSIETSKGTNGAGSVTLVIRNTGTQNIDTTKLSAYVNDAPCTGTGTVNPLIPGAYLTTPISLTNCLTCTCTSGICYNSGKIETIIITIGTGLQNSATVTC